MVAVARRREAPIRQIAKDFGISESCLNRWLQQADIDDVAGRTLGFSKQAYYKWRKSPVSAPDWDDAHLINAASDIHRDDPAFGYRFITDELNVAGHAAGENRIARLRSLQRIDSIFSKKHGLHRRPWPPVHDLVGRQFTAAAPDVIWLVDITEHHTGEGKPYLCAIKDVFSNRIVGDGYLPIVSMCPQCALRGPKHDC